MTNCPRAQLVIHILDLRPNFKCRPADRSSSTSYFGVRWARHSKGSHLKLKVSFKSKASLLRHQGFEQITKSANSRRYIVYPEVVQRHATFEFTPPHRRRNSRTIFWPNRVD